MPDRETLELITVKFAIPGILFAPRRARLRNVTAQSFLSFVQLWCSFDCADREPANSETTDVLEKTAKNSNHSKEKAFSDEEIKRSIPARNPVSLSNRRNVEKTRSHQANRPVSACPGTFFVASGLMFGSVK
jgi:hypothetical protein